MRAAWIAAAFVLTASGAAAQPADESAMVNMFGNTLISVSPQGVETRMRYLANHRFSGSVPQLGAYFEGTWALNGAQVCRTYKPPLPTRPNPDCSATLPWLQVGQTWAAPNGLTLTLKKGR